MALMTMGEYARYRGVSATLISRYKKQGKLEGAFRLKPGTNRLMIVSKIADRLLDENLNKKFTKDRTNNEPSESEIKEAIERAGISEYATLVEAQKAKETYVAALKKLEYEQKAGNLVDADKVRSDADKAGRLIKEKITSWPGRVSPLLANIKDVFEIEQILIKETNQLLEEISGGLI